ncbi:unnamed protein product [Phytophthora fragariaefolia]|uniref:Unnamed protein product n=1 Tax=Phytophthora fragariaefolia TaxID=1490495 RepID=A0A9W6XRJ3_9STRA|nr:unnamed protein product [Phytophthora fragariaefolia]
MDYQANKFARVFDPNCYLLLSKAMGLTNLGRAAQNLAEGSSLISCDSLIIGIKQDLLIPIQEQRNLVHTLQSYGRHAQLVEVDSKFGLDAMSNHQMQLGVFAPLVRDFVEQQLGAVLPHEPHRYSSLRDRPLPHQFPTAACSDHHSGTFPHSARAMGEDLWQQMLRDCSVRSKLPAAGLLLVGDAESGKSALLARLDEARPGPAEAADDAHAVDTLLAFKTLHALDPRAKESGGDASGRGGAHRHVEPQRLEPQGPHQDRGEASDAAEGAEAGSPREREREREKGPYSLLRLRLQTVVAIVLDLSRPWTIKCSLEQWLSALEGQLLEQINQLPPEARNELYAAIKQHILAYEDPVRGGCSTEVEVVLALT